MQQNWETFGTANVLSHWLVPSATTGGDSTQLRPKQFRISVLYYCYWKALPEPHD